jgi:uncharacterized membrane protein
MRMKNEIHTVEEDLLRKLMFVVVVVVVVVILWVLMESVVVEGRMELHLAKKLILM